MALWQLRGSRGSATTRINVFIVLNKTPQQKEVIKSSLKNLIEGSRT
ncbi:25927_t:CDS:2 [Gigaspora margarita]|uniref:25927_t:CDS:1 n=1 Tax=Gigaspora margarita TaxID=4874 RepID=A0ABN7VH11_GIGMA|nr:25927_t:CDS:2 [Gigaspora margarita]